MSDRNLSEEWRPVLGFEGCYEVSDLGRVRGVARVSTNGRPVPQRIIAQATKSNGYKQVHLAHSDGTKRCRLVHSMVLESFVGPRPAGLVACHDNGNPGENRRNNLRWDTQRNNLLDMRKHGTKPDYSGEKHPQSKLTDASIVQIFAMSKQGVSRKEIARRAGICHSYACMILKGTRRRNAGGYA